MCQGRLICFEGIDGAGKTTLAKRLSDRLAAHGIDASLLHKKEPQFTDPDVTRQMFHIKTALWDYPMDFNLGIMGNRHWLYLIAAWHAALDHCVVRPHLAHGQWLIADGWTYKYVARFALKAEIGESYASHCFRGLTEPDLVIFLDVPPEIAVRRRALFKPSECGRFDGECGDPVESFISYQQKIRRYYCQWSKRYSWSSIQADTEAEDELLMRIDSLVRKRLL